MRCLPNKPMVPTAPNPPTTNPPRPLRRHMGRPLGGRRSDGRNRGEPGSCSGGRVFGGAATAPRAQRPAAHRERPRGLLESTFNAEHDLFAMNLPDLVTEALKLSVTERARLAETLLESLDALSEDRHLWTEEAARRDAELDSDPSRGSAASEVFRDARARLR